MKRSKSLKSLINIVYQALFFIFVLGVFAFSLYKIVVYFDILSFKVFGVKCSGSCPSCPSCPRKSASPSPSPSPSASSPAVSPSPSPSLIASPSPSPSAEISPLPSSLPSPSPSDAKISDGGDGGRGGPGGPGEPPSCGAAVPGAPSLLGVKSIGSGKVSLDWSSVSLVSHYAISYGPKDGGYIYGVADTGNTTSFSIGDLDPKVDYCFAVRGINDCAPGELSNQLCTGGEVLGAADGEVLGASTEVLGATSSEVPLPQVLNIAGALLLFLGIRLVKKS